MRICLLGRIDGSNPLLSPLNMTIRPQVARRLAAEGHEVFAISIGKEDRLYKEEQIFVREIRVADTNSYWDDQPDINRQLTSSQALFEGLMDFISAYPIDILDLAIDTLDSVVTLCRYQGPTAVWLPTEMWYTFGLSVEPPSKVRHALIDLMQYCLSRAGGLLADSQVSWERAKDTFLITDPQPMAVVNAELPNRGHVLGSAADTSGIAADLSAQVTTQIVLSLYKQIICRPVKRPVRRIFQVVDWLDVGDGLSHIARTNAALLLDIGYGESIIARDAHPEVKGETRPLNQAFSEPAGGALFHYAGYNYSTWMLNVLSGPKAIYYHNITPPDYFLEGTNAYQSTAWGYKQLPWIADQFELLIAVSRFNLKQLRRFVRRRLPMMHIYPVIESSDLQDAAYDKRLYEVLRNTQSPRFVFVGRIARNKRQDRLMSLFDYYFREIDAHAQLWLIGSDMSDPDYRLELEQLRNTLKSRDSIHLVGKVSDLQLRAYYRAADVFLCASEHEGFCIPIAQAMAFNVPVIARDCAAVPETMGESGILVGDWDIPRLGDLLCLLVRDNVLRQKIVAKQQSNLVRFSAAEAKKRLAAVAKFLIEGEYSHLFEYTH